MTLRCCRTKIINFEDVVPSATTIYTGNGNLLADRVVDMGGNSLEFLSGGNSQWLLEPDFYGAGLPKLTIPGVVDPVAIQLTNYGFETSVAAVPGLGSLWVSDGSDGFPVDHLIFRDGNDVSYDFIDLISTPPNYVTANLVATANRTHTFADNIIVENYAEATESLSFTKRGNLASLVLTEPTNISQLVLDPNSVSISLNDGVDSSSFAVETTGLALNMTGGHDLRVNSAPGNSGQALLSQGAGSPPVWGNILTTDTNFANTNLAATADRQHTFTEFDLTLLFASTIGFTNTQSMLISGTSFVSVLSQPGISTTGTFHMRADSFLYDSEDGTDTSIIFTKYDEGAYLGLTKGGGLRAEIGVSEGAVTGDAQPYVRTQEVAATNSVLNQVLTLIDPATGEAEWKSLGAASYSALQTGLNTSLQTITAVSTDADAPAEGDVVVLSGAGVLYNPINLINTGLNRIDIVEDGIYKIAFKICVHAVASSGGDSISINKLVLNGTTVVINGLTGAASVPINDEYYNNHTGSLVDFFSQGDTLQLLLAKVDANIDLDIVSLDFSIIHLP